MKTVHIIWFLLLMAAGGLAAQQLRQPLEDVPMSNKGLVLLTSGEEFEGRIVNTSSNQHGLTQVVLEVQGEKRKFKANEVSEFLIAMNDAVRFQYTNERGSSVKKLLNKNQPSAVPEDFIIYRSVHADNGPNVLLQLLNPGFDEAFEVFYDPQARKSTEFGGEHITWTGDQHRVFLVSKYGGELIRVKKGSYKKDFNLLFGDCEVMKQIDKPDFKDLEKHLLEYSQHCEAGIQ